MPTSFTQSNLQSGSLVVSSKVLGHISEGLYRGPAGVLKELISNAFDANATTVWISTGRPTFDVVSVRDDGDGMTKEKFIEIVSGGIGDSDKRTTEVPLINNRQVVGRLGIGILGISQISHEFSIISHERKSRTAFRANVQMKDFRKELLDQAPDLDDQGFSVGGYTVEDIAFDPKREGLTITATDPTEGFRQQLAEDNPQALPMDFPTFVQSNRIKDELATGSWYNRMIWQVASLAPIPYMPNPVLPGLTVPCGDEAMTSIARALEDFDFTVMVDGVRLVKPILLDGPTSQVPKGIVGHGTGPFHFSFELDETVWGAQLRVLGYLYSTAGAALHPDDIRGVLIRLKHVGIGEYDKSLLGYRYAEGPRFAWLTGELFVEEGLEDALTVGRDGFDAGHPHYIALRSWLHNELRTRVFPTLYRGIEYRRFWREASRQEKRASAFQELISDFAGFRIETGEAEDPEGPPVWIDLEQGVAIVNTAAKWPRGKRRREMTQKLSIIFEMVRLQEPDDRAVHKFVDLISDLLSQR